MFKIDYYKILTKERLNICRLLQNFYFKELKELHCKQTLQN